MDELSLQFFIFKNFSNFSNLYTVQGKNVKIINIGEFNCDAGPDFVNAHVVIDNVQWFGNIEIHIKSSDWDKHIHSENRLYDNVILHIVLEHDKQIFKNDNTPLPTIEIKQHINKFLTSDSLENKFCNFSQLKDTFPMLLLHRLKKKNDFIISLLHGLKDNWESTAFHLLMYNFGFKINNEQMLQLASSIDYKVIQKNKDNEEDLLAILAGQGGLLEKFDQSVRDKYNFFKQKYNLQVADILWKYARTHPQNFPEIRIQQIAKLLHKKNSLLEWLNDVNLDFLTEQTVNHIKINVSLPLQFTYNQYYCKPVKHILEKFKDIKAEDNKIIRNCKKLGIKVDTSYESQALIELTNTMCKKNKCLICPLFKF